MPTYHPCGKCEVSFDFCRCEWPKMKGPMKQKNDYTCAPVAIRNACWALGIRIPSVNGITKACGTDEDGTTVEGLYRGAAQAGLKLTRVRAKSRGRVNEIVYPNKCPLILGYTVGGEGHYCVIVRQYQLSPGMGIKYGFLALNWATDVVVAFDTHSNLFVEAPITLEWLIGKLLARGTDVYLVSER